MLQLSPSLKDIPVMSLRTGGLAATALRPVINPNNLKIEGWYCKDATSKKTLVLLSKDVRDIVPQGLAIDDHDVLSEASELLRLKEILTIDFDLVGKSVVTDSGRRLGKVVDYATDMSSLYIQKFYVSQPVYKNLAGGQLSIDRTQIVEITPKNVTVRDVDEKVTGAVGALVTTP